MAALSQETLNRKDRRIGLEPLRQKLSIQYPHGRKIEYWITYRPGRIAPNLNLALLNRLAKIRGVITVNPIIAVKPQGIQINAQGSTLTKRTPYEDIRSTVFGLDYGLEEIT